MCEKKFKCPACGGDGYITEILGVLVNGQPVRSCLSLGCKFSWLKSDDDKYLVEQKPHPNQRFIDAINNGQTVYWLKPLGWNPDGSMEPITAHELTISPNDKSYGPGRLFIAGEDIPEKPTAAWVTAESLKDGRKYQLTGCCRAPAHKELCVWQAGFRQPYDIAPWYYGEMPNEADRRSTINWRWIVEDLGPTTPVYKPWDETTVKKDAWIVQKTCANQTRCRILSFDKTYVWLPGKLVCWPDLLAKFEQDDGTPCGELVK